MFHAPLAPSWRDQVAVVSSTTYVDMGSQLIVRDPQRRGSHDVSRKQQHTNSLAPNRRNCYSVSTSALPFPLSTVPYHCVAVWCPAMIPPGADSDHHRFGLDPLAPYGAHLPLKRCDAFTTSLHCLVDLYRLCTLQIDLLPSLHAGNSQTTTTGLAVAGAAEDGLRFAYTGAECENDQSSRRTTRYDESGAGS